MLIIETLLAAFFVITNVITEVANLKTMNPAYHFISDYLAHEKLSWLQDLGFFALAVNMILLGAHFGHAHFMDTALYLAAVGMVLMVPTKTLQKPDATDALTIKQNTVLEKMHRYSTGISFVLANYALIRYAIDYHHHFALCMAVVGPVLTSVYYRIWHDKFPAIEEKVYTGFLLASVFSILSVLSGVI